MMATSTVTGRSWRAPGSPPTKGSVMSQKQLALWQDMWDYLPTIMIALIILVVAWPYLLGVVLLHHTVLNYLLEGVWVLTLALTLGIKTERLYTSG